VVLQPVVRHDLHLVHERHRRGGAVGVMHYVNDAACDRSERFLREHAVDEGAVYYAHAFTVVVEVSRPCQIDNLRASP
jgi:hypothetical protein